MPFVKGSTKNGRPVHADAYKPGHSDTKSCTDCHLSRNNDNNAILAQLATFHSLEDLRIAVLAGGDRLRHWEWVKWLPQALHPDEVDGAGAARLVSDNWIDLERLLGGTALDERGRFEPGVVPTAMAYILYVIGLRTTPVTVSGVLTLVEPLTATLLGVLFFGDRLGLVGALGAALLISAVAGLTLRR